VDKTGDVIAIERKKEGALTACDLEEQCPLSGKKRKKGEGVWHGQEGGNSGKHALKVRVIMSWTARKEQPIGSYLKGEGGMEGCFQRGKEVVGSRAWKRHCLSRNRAVSRRNKPYGKREGVRKKRIELLIDKACHQTPSEMGGGR